MAISLSSLRSTKRNDPPIMLLYGVDGIGKTSLAAEFPSPLFLGTEGERPPSDVDLPTPGVITSLNDVFDVFGELLDSEHDFGTVIIDSLDGLEPLIWRATCARLGLNSIEDAGFGKGYVEADTEWNEYLSAVAALAQAGIYVVQLAHPEIVRFDSPTSDPYSRYQPKLHKRANALVREKADVVAFMNYRISIKEKEVARQTKVAHAEGGKERQIHLNEGAGFNAKNRFSMPDSISYKKGDGFAALAKYWPSNDNAARQEAA
ncbi:oxidoreductase [Shinella sumterensis]|uniref:ATP-binding protein n=1 Tax=Shinella sumterensis TaxID=1967501 RepID=UPI00106EA210|nr:ATP-binding protein [Shinella sumterensis]MCD1264027.1 AAA family ATPase [Shinella sumterensis]TFE99434.1 oxidoreductase [Shinella sumterensis]